MHLFRRLTLAAALAVVIAPLLTASAASANPAPEFACGTTQPGPCSETAHYTDQNEWLTPPIPLPAGCPSFMATDVALVTGVGNGVEHITVNKAQDAWFTSTFAGNVTVTLYPLSSVVLDPDGNVVAVIGPPDASQPVFTGNETEWFGGSFNNKNSVVHGTLTLDVVGGVQTLHAHDAFHASWAPGADPNGPPTKAFDKLTCP